MPFYDVWVGKASFLFERGPKIEFYFEEDLAVVVAGGGGLITWIEVLFDYAKLFWPPWDPPVKGVLVPLFVKVLYVLKAGYEFACVFAIFFWLDSIETVLYWSLISLFTFYDSYCFYKGTAACG